MQSASRAQQRIGGVLELIRELTTRLLRTESEVELFDRAYRALHPSVPFDLGVAVMVEQNLDLYAVGCTGAQLDDALIARIRHSLETEIPVSFESTDVMVRSEAGDLPGEARGRLEHDARSIVKHDTRTAGMLLLYRCTPEFTQEERQVLEIFSAQVSLLLGSMRARAQILNLADTDDLTGIWNKRYFRRQLPQEVERARVYNLPLSLLMMDVDDFKLINDNFGHTVGDVVLSELCGTVRESLRPPDLFARFGGDELAIILPHTDLAGATAVAERILKRVAELTIPADEEGAIRCSLSIGAADFHADTDDAAELIRRADAKLYLAKRQGKNRVVS
jgi:diguanylate cyclase (GGDEF)-like protein